jgi:hypothetical protein
VRKIGSAHPSARGGSAAEWDVDARHLPCDASWPRESFAGRGNPAHTEWPGAADADDPALAQFLASQNSTPVDLALDHRFMRRLGAELLDRTGPAIVITNSAGGPSG